LLHDERWWLRRRQLTSHRRDARREASLRTNNGTPRLAFTSAIQT